jgi:hypothetical protein
MDFMGFCFCDDMPLFTLPVIWILRRTVTDTDTHTSCRLHLSSVTVNDHQYVYATEHNKLQSLITAVHLCCYLGQSEVLTNNSNSIVIVWLKSIDRWSL